jgi:hypothetical protein
MTHSIRDPFHLVGFWLLAASCIATAAGFQGQTLVGGQGSRPKAGETSFQELQVRSSLNSGWLFKRQASPGPADEAVFTKAEQPGYDDTSWVRVSLPHLGRHLG